MTDEELLIMYNKYKKKRKIIFIFVVILIISVLVLFTFNKKNKDEIDKQTDTEPPKIVLIKDYDEIEEGSSIKYKDYIKSVTDNSKEDLLNKVTYNEIDTSKEGEYVITYEVVDSSKNKAQAKLKIKVYKKEEVKESEKEQETPPENITPTQENPIKEPEKEPISPSKDNSNNTPSTNQKIVKYFLFSDGYTMQNVASVCAEELKKTGKAGMCSPIQDENGIYLGMKLETN